MTTIDQQTFCVIPARRGSKRLPLKNLSLVKGEPLMAYAIREALKTGLFAEVYVATEDEEIAAVARRYGATVPALVPAELCGDYNPSWEPCLYLADYLKKNNKLAYDTLVCLQPTSVLRTSEDIMAGFKAFKESDFEFLVSVTPVDPHYFHWAMIEEAGSWRMYFEKKFMKERHELPPVFRPNGAVKIAKIEKLREEKNFFGANLGVSFMPEERSLHVVSQTDLKIAEALLE